MKLPTWHIPLIYKLSVLLVLMVLGFSILGYQAYENMNRMKKSLDLVYFGSYMQVLELKNVKEVYSDNVTKTVISAKNGLLSPRRASQNLKKAQKTIREHWNYYKKSYKTDEEKAYVSAVDKAIAESFSWMKVLQKTFQKADKEKVQSISISGLFKRVDGMNKLIGDLIQYEVDQAYYQKSQINNNYDETLYEMGVILAVIFSLATLVALLIIRNIQKNHKTLEETTQELKFANAILKNISITDPLTSVYNRRYFNVMFEKEIKRAYRDKHHVTFMMMDIDHFKQYNDTYGHGAGDVALKRVAECMKNILKRPGDYVFRLGGEEFGLLVTESDPDKIKSFAQHIGKMVEGMKIEHKKNSASAYVTISIGIITLIPDSKTRQDDVIHQADEALYKAKKNGRNQVVVAEWKASA